MRKHTKRKLFLLSLAILVIIVFLVSKISNKSDSMYEKNKKDYQTLFFEDFSNYEQNSEVIETAPEDLSRWKNGGTFTAWAEIDDWKKYERINLMITDSDGESKTFEGVLNVKTPREENKIKSDDNFEDYYFNCEQKLKKWEDFMLVNGRNLLFWEFNQSTDIDMSNIVSWEIFDGDNKIEISELVIHDGLCEKTNSLNGNWYTPNGLPQYGVWWTTGEGLVMKNVEQEQYPSNGDHVRILSKELTPKNFLMRTRFKVENLNSRNSRLIPPWVRHIIGMRSQDPLKNTYIRIAWDFDNEYDPGHDQTFVYTSFEYDSSGLKRIFPIERYFLQDSDPKTEYSWSKTKLKLKNNNEYELQIKVDGQLVNAKYYLVEKNHLKEIGSFYYRFNKPRPEKQYPFSIETTGNVEIILKEIEVMEKIQKM